MVTWSTLTLRSAIISSRFRKLSPNRRYQRTHRTMTSASKCLPLNSAGRFRRIHRRVSDALRYRVCNTSAFSNQSSVALSDLGARPRPARAPQLTFTFASSNSNYLHQGSFSRCLARPGDIVAVQVHDLIPRGGEVFHELLLRSRAGIDLREG